MKLIRRLLVAIAIASAFPAVVQVLGPLGEFFGWLKVLLTPGMSYDQPTTLQVGSEACRQLTISLALLAVPLVLWLIARVGRERPSSGVE